MRGRDQNDLLIDSLLQAAQRGPHGGSGMTGRGGTAAHEHVAGRVRKATRPLSQLLGRGPPPRQQWRKRIGARRAPFCQCAGGGVARPSARRNSPDALSRAVPLRAAGVGRPTQALAVCEVRDPERRVPALGIVLIATPSRAFEGVLRRRKRGPGSAAASRFGDGDASYTQHWHRGRERALTGEKSIGALADAAQAAAALVARALRAREAAGRLGLPALGAQERPGHVLRRHGANFKRRDFRATSASKRPGQLGQLGANCFFIPQFDLDLDR
eukprot:scaffold11295_cov120-Isochrysis_galbana.AAC.2